MSRLIVIGLWGLFLCGTSVRVRAAQPQKVWIDTDIAIGKFDKDVDDGIALIMALRSPAIEIKGISLISHLKYGEKITQQLLRWYHTGKTIPVYAGAADAHDLGQSTPAVQALAQALREDKLTIIALGPATTIATVLLLHPELASQMTRIVWCAGRTPGLKFNPGRGNINVCDCNFDKDPRAGEILLTAKVPLTLSGYEPASSVHISKEDLRPLKESRSEADRWLYRQLNDWLRIWRVLLGSPQGFVPFDAITLGSWLHPEYMQYHKDIPVSIRQLDNDAWWYTRQRQKPYLIASYDLTTPYRANYHYQTSAGYKGVILTLLTGQPVETAKKNR